ncbi:hypothetical protein P152DRAFT_66515 [Eremomyces bilateralis CBS 781.70]|uniref:Uncharacterized protein n=1 Tax=Eremomyces bilateralis CBS 781.70 TaxID=1392243 RepID=A0A6G1FZL9_9PEZI|nr:uncharacterized protein P152DRAFT_66515 [Eremomyces bilateralis CBS 781.70]KAF1811244.1 hypothetical protein P152DRAFT_66515 [Eremomyces bilateralis CBS 781.70]
MRSMSVTRVAVVLLGTLSSLLPLAIANPVLAPRASVPGPPKDPPLPSGDGSGEYNTIWLCGPNDYKVRALLEGGVLAFAAKGWCQASRAMNHYLLDNGKDLNENVANMMEDTPAFKKAVHALAEKEAKDAVDFIGPWVTKTFNSGWKVWHAWNKEKNEAHNLDWYYALGEYSYAVTGVLTNGGTGKVKLEWKAHIFDRYNWDNSGKKQSFGPISVTHKEIGHLHKCGGAREYVVRGSSKEQVVNNYNSKKPLPAVDTSGSSSCWWQPAKE